MPPKRGPGGEPAKVPTAGEDRKAVVFGEWSYRTEQLSWQIPEKKDRESPLGFLKDSFRTNFMPCPPAVPAVSSQSREGRSQMLGNLGTAA